MTDIQLTEYTSADHDWLVEQHQMLYSQSDGFDQTFGPLVDGILTDFEDQSDPKFEQGWIAREGAHRLGSIFCVKIDEKTAKLRMFLLLPQARRKGIGKQLLKHCMSFAKARGFKRMTLWTHESHQAACALYTRFGWTCVSSKPVQSFGVSLIEQQWEITL